MWLETFNQMRQQSGMSLDDLSEKSGVPKGTLAKISSGITKTPSLETMKSLVYAMGYTLDDLDRGIKTPLNPDGPDQGEYGRSVVSEDAVEEILVRLGFISPGEDLTDTDLQFLLGIGQILEAWFRQREKG